MTVNGIVTVNPYEYIGEMEKRCLTLSDLATVDINRNQITRIHNTLESLKQNISTLQARIQSSVDYEENMVYLDENIYMLTSVIQEGIQEYIHVETTNLQEVRIEQERHNQKSVLALPRNCDVCHYCGTFSYRKSTSKCYGSG